MLQFEDYLKKYNISLSSQQAAVVKETEGPVVVSACPGSGKTHTLVARLGYMIYGKGIHPRNILVMTYTVAATQDMKKRFESVFGEEDSAELEFRTINGVSARIINAYERKGHTAFQLVNDEKFLNSLIADILKECMTDFPTESDIKEARTQITFCKNMMLKREEREAIENDAFKVNEVYQKYVEYMRNNKLMDYDDQMVYAFQILKKEPDVLNLLQDQYQYICVDEAQDTSKIQHEIIRLLASRNENLFMVGDEDQSIYLFRAAYPEALVGFEAQHPGAKVFYLEENYRSTGTIVKAAAKFIEKNPDRFQKTMMTKREDGQEMEEKRFSKREYQYAFLFDEAKKQPSNAAILFRDNDNILPLLDRLIHEGVPYKGKQISTLFFSNKYVLDILDILQFSKNPKDTLLFQKLYLKLNLFIKKEIILKAIARTLTSGITCLDAVYELVKDNPTKASWIMDRMRILENISRVKEIPRALFFINSGLGYPQNASTGFYSKFFILNQLAKNAVRYGFSDPSCFSDYLDDLREKILNPKNLNHEGIILSTIHSSKGLEYDTVYLIDCIKGQFPVTTAPKDKNEELLFHEERRLFYVAVTRAKNRLILFCYNDYETSFVEELTYLRSKLRIRLLLFFRRRSV